MKGSVIFLITLAFVLKNNSDAIFVPSDIRCPPGYDYPGGNQFRANGTFCDRECALEGLIDNCPVKTYGPVDRWFCKFGYARDYNCVCVPLGDCPRCASYWVPNNQKG